MKSMENVWQKVESLEVKIKKLAEAYHNLKQDLKDCQNENEVLRRELEIKNEELKSFHNQFKISKIVSSVAMDKKLATEFKNKINDYIKEIEKGLAYLNKV